MNRYLSECLAAAVLVGTTIGVTTVMLRRQGVSTPVPPHHHIPVSIDEAFRCLCHMIAVRTSDDPDVAPLTFNDLVTAFDPDHHQERREYANRYQRLRAVT